MSYIYPAINKMIDSIAKDNEIDFDTECDKIYKCVRDYYGYYFPQKKDTDYRQPDGSDPYYQIAYLYMYSAIRADLISYIFNEEPELDRLLASDMDESGYASVCVLGTGPGTELIGLGKWAEKRGIEGQINFILSECVKEWEKCIGYAEKYSVSSSDACKAHIQDFIYSCTPLSNETFSEKGLRECKIFIVSYVISEIIENSTAVDDFQAFFASLCTHSQSESLFLFIDRNERRVERCIKKIAESCNISFPKISYPLSDRNPYQEGKNFEIDPMEDKAILHKTKLYQELKVKLNRSPQYYGNVLWAIGQKR